MNRISMWDTPLVGLLSVIKSKLEQDDVEGAIENIDRLMAQIEGWYEE